MCRLYRLCTFIAKKSKSMLPFGGYLSSKGNFLLGGYMKVNVYRECVHYRHKITKAPSLFCGVPIFLRQKLLGKFEIPYIEMFVTTKCNLQCRNCSNLIPYIEKRENIPFAEFKRDLDSLLSKTDRLYRLKIHGGEVFLHPELFEIIRYADEQSKIKSIRLATNGTVLPSAKVLNTLADSKVVVQISDYSAFSDRAEKLVKILGSNGVKYVRLYGQKWQDMGKIKKRATNRFESCSITRCTSLYRGKIYVCSRAAMMEELGCHFYGGIDITSDKEVFRKEMTLLYNGGHGKACWYCDGDTEFAKEIPAGEQLS